VNGMGPDNEISLVQNALNDTFPRAGCRPYPDFMSFSSESWHSLASVAVWILFPRHVRLLSLLPI
jgi:hypothetical protein